MNDAHHHLLEKVFANAEQELDGGVFINHVMARARRRGRQRLLLLGAACLAAAPAIWLVATPLNELVLSLNELIFRPVADADAGVAAPILSPLNSVASLFVLGLLALRAFYRWLTR